MPNPNDNQDTNPSTEDIESPVNIPAIASEADPTRTRRQPRASRSNRTRRAGRPDLAIVTPTASEILSGSDSELRKLARRVSRAERAASRQTERARELIRRLNSSEASLSVRAENERLRASIADYRVIVGAYANGDYELGDALTEIMDSKTRRFASIMTRDSRRIILEFTERAELRRQYIRDSHGHRVRRDMLDSNNECAECKRENQRLAEQATSNQSG